MHLGEVRNKFNILIINLHVMLLFSAEASHVLVSFFEENDQPTAIIHIKRVKDTAVKDIKEGVVCKVEWSDRKIYSTRVLACGTQTQLQKLQEQAQLDTAVKEKDVNTGKTVEDTGAKGGKTK